MAALPHGRLTRVVGYSSYERLPRNWIRKVTEAIFLVPPNAVPSRMKIPFANCVLHNTHRQGSVTHAQDRRNVIANIPLKINAEIWKWLETKDVVGHTTDGRKIHIIIISIYQADTNMSLYMSILAIKDIFYIYLYLAISHQESISNHYIETYKKS